jgi:hypothetical protein
MRTPGAQRARVLARARVERRHQRVGASQDHIASRAQLQRERRVEHVRGGQAVVDPPARLARRRAQHVHERRHVVVGHALAFVDRLHRECRLADRLEIGRRRALSSAQQLGQLLARSHLDPAPDLHASLIRPQTTELVTCVAGDHSPGVPLMR